MAAEHAVHLLPNAWGTDLVGWDAFEYGPLPGPTGHTRIVIGPHAMTADLQPGAWLGQLGGRERFLEGIGPEDIVYIPLINSRTVQVGWDQKPCADFDVHTGLIEELAPKVRGILVGNMGPEFCANQGPGTTFKPDEGLRFIEWAGGIVKEAGGTPFFGTVDWTLLLDCYRGNGRLRDAMVGIGAVQVCFCGYTLHDGCFYDRANNYYKGHTKWMMRAENAAPGPRLCEYIRSTEIWTDLNWMPGYEAGNDKLLCEMGFARGCL